MFLSTKSFTWNLGDTSFRRKAVIDDYKILLNQLNILHNDYIEWNDKSQEEFYNRVIRNTDLVKYDKNKSSEEKSKLARTYTNCLYKIGFCSDKRVLSKVGFEYIKNDNNLSFDDFEMRLHLKKDNILFLRQLLKFQVCKKDSEKSLSPFILLIKFLNKYDYLSKKEFSVLIHMSNENSDVKKLLDNFAYVRNGTISLENFLSSHFCDNNINSIEKDKFIENDNFDEKIFRKIFFNRKSSNSIDKYIEFYKRINIYKDNKNKENLGYLINIMRDKKIKKSFGTSKLIKDVNNKDITPEKFDHLMKNIDIFKLSGSNFRKSFYDRFLYYKREDLVKEYVDVTIRIFNTTGIINFQNDTVKISNLYAKEYFKAIDDKLNAITKNDQDVMLENVTINEILKVNYSTQVDDLIAKKYKIKNKNDVCSYIKSLEDEKFKKFIKNNFKKEKVIDILRLISLRDDGSIFKKVTDQASISTIFEYILAIAWLYISQFNFNIYNSMNLTLDNSYYPLSHAPGGNGDIIIEYENHKLMLEATLMNINTQKRGELEPVIRHSVNLTTQSKEQSVYTLFIANELDDNVINIFRFCKYIKLYNSKNKSLTTTGTNILSLSIDNIIHILEKDISYDKILNCMQKELSVNDISLVNDNWKNRFIDSILN